MGIITRKNEIKWERGFHARPCTLFIKVASRFTDCKILVSNEKGESVNGHSIVGLLTLAVPKGKFLTVQVTGKDNKKCADELQEMFDSVEENL